MSSDLKLANHTTTELAKLLGEGGPVIALVPVGSTEPHGPHLPLSTDLLISEGACERGARKLLASGVSALIAPGISYGVTDYAEGFSGALSIPSTVLQAFLRAVTESLLGQGFAHVCLVNNHLEPAHDAAVRASITDFDRKASVACPLTRRWAKTLTPEFKSGACHAGRYETSLVAAVAPELVRSSIAASLPSLGISLSEGIKSGLATFRDMGINNAYTGAPREGSAAEGDEILERLAEMIFAEVTEKLAPPVA